MSINIEISIGEALDKLSILEIKKNKINDNAKLLNINNEYNYLYNLVFIYLSINANLYNLLQKINEEIWVKQELIRNVNSIDNNTINNNIDDNINDNISNNINDICMDIIKLNDSRNIIKRKINIINKSRFIEEKNYKQNELNIILVCVNVIKENLNSAIIYFSTLYDKINIFIEESDYLQVMRNKYNYDKTINVYSSNYLNDINEISYYIDNLENDYIVIFNNDIIKRINHKYLNKAVINNNKEYSKELNNLYEKINLSIDIYDKYKKLIT